MHWLHDPSRQIRRTLKNYILLIITGGYSVFYSKIETSTSNSLTHIRETCWNDTSYTFNRIYTTRGTSLLTPNYHAYFKTSLVCSINTGKTATVSINQDM